MRRTTLVLAAAVVLAAVTSRAGAQALTLETVNAAEFPPRTAGNGRATMLKAQVLLDRAGFSPGAIDGRAGENSENALAAFEREQGLPVDGKLDEATWARLVGTSAEPVLREYRITAGDVRGPFVRRIPKELPEMARLDRLAYRTPIEAIAERFHMSEDLLEALNPRKAFRAGATIVVADVARASPAEGKKETVRRIEIDKAVKALRAYGGDGRLIAYYPASIGSSEKPAPSGTHHVRAVAKRPAYYYDPDFKFRGVEADERLRVAPGPNNPVGSVWIDLSIPTYGIHGTPEPRRVGKTYSHGCIRLTNWDAEDLARMVEKGTVVTFVN